MWDRLPRFFDGVAPDRVEEALAVFQTVEVEAGTRLIEEGEHDPTLVIVQHGELEVTTGGTRLGRATAGDVVGEMALFGGGMRTATVTSAHDSVLMILDQAGYEALREVEHPVASAIEAHALDQLTDRLRITGQRIASLSKGTEMARAVPRPGLLERMKAAFSPGNWLSSTSGVEVLSRSPIFADVANDTLAVIASAFYPIEARPGEYLCTEGKAGSSMYVVASGRVEVVNTAASGRTQHLATLQDGEAFGMCALLQPEAPGMASCIARERLRALALDRLAFIELIHRPDAAGSAMRTACIRALIDKLAFANGQLSQLDLRRAREEAHDPAAATEYLCAATAAMEAHGAYLSRAASRYGLPHELER